MPNSHNLGFQAMRFTGSPESAESIIEWVERGNGHAFYHRPDEELLSTVNARPSLWVETPDGFNPMPRNWWVFQVESGIFLISSTGTADEQANSEFEPLGPFMDLGVVELPLGTKRATIILPLDEETHIHEWGEWEEIQKNPRIPIKFFQRNCEGCLEITQLEVFPDQIPFFKREEDI